MSFDRVFKLYDRIAITGAPQCGKTTLAKTITDRPVLHSDDFKHLAWSDASQVMADKANAIEGPLIVEGVAVPRALRKGMKIDAVILLTQPKLAPEKRDPVRWKHQVAMGKGVMKVLREWRANNPRIPVYAEPFPGERIGQNIADDDPNELEHEA